MAKLIWFVFLLNLVAISITYVSYSSLNFIFSRLEEGGPLKMAALLFFTLAPLLYLFLAGIRRGWRNLSFPLTFFLVAISTISFFVFADLLASILRTRP